MTKRTQRDRRSSDKSNGLAAKWKACGLLRDYVVEKGLTKLVRDVVRCVEGDKLIGVLKANEALLKAEMELNGGLEGGHVGAAQRLRVGVYFFETYLFYVVNFVHLNTMTHYLEMILRRRWYVWYQW